MPLTQEYHKYMEDIETLTGLREKIARDYMMLYQTLCLHYLSEQVNDANEILKKFDVDLPGIGTIHFWWSGDRLEYKIKLNRAFLRKINNVRSTGESPLSEQIEEGLMDKINKNYDSLL